VPPHRRDHASRRDARMAAAQSLMLPRDSTGDYGDRTMDLQRRTKGELPDRLSGNREATTHSRRREDIINTRPNIGDLPSMLTDHPGHTQHRDAELLRTNEEGRRKRTKMRKSVASAIFYDESPPVRC